MTHSGIDKLKVATLHARGFVSRHKQYQVKRLLIDNDHNVLAIQGSKVEIVEQTARLLASSMLWEFACSA